MDIIDAQISEHETLLRLYLLTRQTGYTTSQLNIIDEKDAIMICGIGDKHKISQKTDKLFYIHNVENYLKEHNKTQILLDNSYIIRLCERNLQALNIIKDNIQTHGDIITELDELRSEYNELRNKYEIKERECEDLNFTINKIFDN